MEQKQNKKKTEMRIKMKRNQKNGAKSIKFQHFMNFQN